MKKYESRQKKEIFVELRAMKGMSLDAISEELDISKSTAVSWEKEFKDSILSIKNAHFSFLVDTYCLGIEARLKSLKDLSETLRVELEKRDISDISSDKLVSLYLETLKKTSEHIDRYSVRESSRDEFLLNGLDFL